MLANNLKLKAFAWLWIAFGVVSYARGDALSDAQVRRAEAMNSYFTALQNGHVTKPSDARRLADQMIGPASDAVAQQINQNRQDAIRELLADKAALSSSSPTRTPASGGVSPGLVQDSLSAVPDTSPLDGSGTPKQLEFRPVKRPAVTLPTSK